MDSDRVRSCGIVTATIGVLVFLYCWFSFDVVFPTEVGIDFSVLSYTLTGRLETTPGRFWLGLGHSFISLPIKLETIDFTNTKSKFQRGGPLSSRTSDGLEVSLEVSLQYRLIAKEAINLYQKLGPDYEAIFVLAAIDTVTREATKHDAEQFFSRRDWVSGKIQERMQEDFNRSYFSDIEFFQLRSVSLPRQFESEIQNTEVQKQDIKKAEAERGHQAVTGETRVLTATQQGKAIDLQAQANVRTIQLNNVAYVTQFNLTQGLQAEGFAQIYSLVDDSEAKLLEYLDVRALRDHPSASSVISIPMAE